MVFLNFNNQIKVHHRFISKYYFITHISLKNNILSPFTKVIIFMSVNNESTPKAFYDQEDSKQRLNVVRSLVSFP